MPKIISLAQKISIYLAEYLNIREGEKRGKERREGEKGEHFNILKSCTEILNILAQKFSIYFHRIFRYTCVKIFDILPQNISIYLTEFLNIPMQKINVPAQENSIYFHRIFQYTWQNISIYFNVNKRVRKFSIY